MGSTNGVFLSFSHIAVASIHDFKYDYSLVRVNQKGNIKVKCKQHGIFETTMLKHRNGAGCPKCEELDSKKEVDAEFLELVKKFNEKYNFKYNYVKAGYKSIGRKIFIECPQHGIFKQTAKQHLLFSGCKGCTSSELSEVKIDKSNGFFVNEIKKELLIEMFLAVYGENYIYDSIEFKKLNKKISVGCKKHGVFQVTPLDHIRGVYCEKCRKNKMESI